MSVQLGAVGMAAKGYLGIDLPTPWKPEFSNEVVVLHVKCQPCCCSTTRPGVCGRATEKDSFYCAGPSMIGLKA